VACADLVKISIFQQLKTTNATYMNIEGCRISSLHVAHVLR